jgi:hypothetical protein
MPYFSDRDGLSGVRPSSSRLGFRPPSGLQRAGANTKGAAPGEENGPRRQCSPAIARMTKAKVIKSIATR